MSLEYCEECDKMIDLDYDLEHEHFQKEQRKMKTIKGDLIMEEDMTFKESLNVAGNIFGKDGKRFNLKVEGDLKCRDLKCLDLKCWDLECRDLKCWDLKCRDLKCLDLECRDLKCRDLKCRGQYKSWKTIR